MNNSPASPGPSRTFHFLPADEWTSQSVTGKRGMSGRRRRQFGLKPPTGSGHCRDSGRKVLHGEVLLFVLIKIYITTNCRCFRAHSGGHHFHGKDSFSTSCNPLNKSLAFTRSIRIKSIPWHYLKWFKVKVILQTFMIFRQFMSEVGQWHCLFENQSILEIVGIHLPSP